ncbi:MAG: pyrroline-5-carboxylate reductase [Bacteroidales bacterium]|nr:pyrroline-5-carboxylate reductase [Bacteroidales bacterium]
MRIAIIGAGNMGGAIAKGLSKSTLFAPQDITCTAKSAATTERLGNLVPGINIYTDNCKAVKDADFVIISVKPWLMESILSEISPVLDFSRQVVISVAAGIPFEQLCTYLNTDPSVPTLFRVIPNTAVEVQCSMTFIASHNATPEQCETVERIFKELGHVIMINESHMASATILASCGIAFAMRYIRAAAEAGVELGFSPAMAHNIVEHTVKGAAELLLQSGNHPEVEIDKVTTPYGITIKGLNAMENEGFTSAVIKGLKACMK